VKLLNKPIEVHRTQQMGEHHLCVLNSALEFEGKLSWHNTPQTKINDDFT
jgi:hypothetical protein